MTAYREYRMQLKDGSLGSAIIAAGGTCHVATAGSPDKATIYADKDGTALANPLTPVRGFINFFTLDTVASVDLYIQAPGGQFVVVEGVVAGGPNEIHIATTKREQMYKIPFSIADAVANTEKDTGFDFPAKAIVLDRLHGLSVNVTTLDASQNILFGILSTESGGDADGLSTNVSLTTAVQKIAVNGALFSTNAPFMSDSITGKSISYTLDTSTDTGKGFIEIPVRLA
jgi:hypothetical protein